MRRFTVAQERQAACLVCPARVQLVHPCHKEKCSMLYQDSLRRSPRYREQVLAVCHWLYDENLAYFGIEEEW